MSFISRFFFNYCLITLAKANVREISAEPDPVDTLQKFSGVRPSLFPNVPPYYKFVLYNESIQAWPQEVQKYLTWRRSATSRRIIRDTLKHSGFTLTTTSKAYNFNWAGFRWTPPIEGHHKINQNPGGLQLDNKARLWRNLQRSIFKYGQEAYDFVPETYLLPKEKKLFRNAWEAKNCDVEGCMWIAKPPGMVNGWGIKIINNWNQVVESNRNVYVTQEYIKPLLVNNRKFDLRLYVLVTSFRPLRAFMYQQGFVRFAVTVYSNYTCKSNVRTMHLTNRWINKRSSDYVKGENMDTTTGSQWSVQALWNYMEKLGIDMTPTRAKIEDLVIKTLMSVEPSVTKQRFLLSSRYSSYELYGFDVGIDDKLKPWLFEVNRSPGMQTDSGFLRALKGKLTTEYLNIVGYHFPPSLSTRAQDILKTRLTKGADLANVTYDPRLYQQGKSLNAEKKHEKFTAVRLNTVAYSEDILSRLTGDDLRELITAEDELTQCEDFVRIFPSARSHLYLNYFEAPNYYNLLLDAWEQKYRVIRSEGIDRLRKACKAKLHLEDQLVETVQ